MEALEDGAGVPLIDMFAISYAPSATIYTWLREQQEAEPVSDDVPQAPDRQARRRILQHRFQCLEIAMNVGKDQIAHTQPFLGIN